MAISLENQCVIWNGDATKNKSHRLWTNGKEYEFSGPNGVSIFISDYNPKDSIVVNGSPKELGSFKQKDFTLQSDWVHKQALSHIAIKWLNAGLIPLPIREAKEPANKKTFKREDLYGKKPWAVFDTDFVYPEKNHDLLNEFKQQNVVGIALLLGPVSKKHDLECFDFDTPDGFGKFISKLKEDHPELAGKIEDNYIEETVNKGVHVFAWVPQGMGKKAKRAQRPNGTPKPDTLIETLGTKKCYAINAPTKLREGAYKLKNAPLLRDGKPRIVLLNKEELKAIIDVCASFDEMPAKAQANIKTVQKSAEKLPAKLSENTSTNLGKWQIANQFLQEQWGWPKVAIKCGFKIQREASPGCYSAFHPNTNDFTSTNVQLGPKDSNSKDVCHIFSTGETLSYYQVWKKYCGVDSLAELYKLAEDAGYKLPQDLVDETRWEDFDKHDENPDAAEDQSDESMRPSAKSKNDFNIREAIAAEKILRSPIKDSLINVFGYKIKHTMGSMHAQSVIPYACAISMLGHYCAKLLKFRTNSPVNHVVILAKTGRGKDHPRHMMTLVNRKLNILQRVPKASIEAKKEKKKTNWIASMINPKGSQQGVEDRLKHSPHAMIVINELGAFLKAASSDDSSGSRFSAIFESFRELWDGPKDHQFRALADKKNTKVKYIKDLYPSMIAYTTPAIFEKYFDRESIKAGSLNRILLFEAGPRWIKDSEGEYIRPKWSGQGEKYAGKIARKIHANQVFYEELKKTGWKLEASDCFKISLSKYEEDAIKQQVQEEENDDETEGIKERERQIAFRLSLIHLFARRGETLEAIDFKWAIGVVRLSHRTQNKLVYEALGDKNVSGKLIFKIRGVIENLYEAKTKKITAGKIANEVFANEKSKRNKDYFVAHCEPELIQLGWIKVLNDGSYDLTPNFWKVGKKQ